MARVIVTERLMCNLERTLRHEADEVLALLKTLEQNPKKGKSLGHVGRILIGELKYKKYRFYYVTDGYRVKFFAVDELKDLIIKFVRISDKKEQQTVIEEIKMVLRSLGDEGF